MSSALIRLARRRVDSVPPPPSQPFFPCPHNSQDRSSHHLVRGTGGLSSNADAVCSSHENLCILQAHLHSCTNYPDLERCNPDICVTPIIASVHGAETHYMQLAPLARC